MAVVIETTLGDITVDLYLDQRPATCLNFLKLCKMKYYNFNLFHSIRSGFIAQTGDPSGEGSGGESIWGILQGPEKRFFSGEKMPKIRHTDAGLLSMVCTDDMMIGSQFFFTLAPNLDSLDGVHCVIGEVTEGHEVLRKLNEVICDETHRPYQDVRITHTVILEDPFNDPPGLRAPSRSPSPSSERLKGGRIAPDEEIDETKGKSAAEVQEMIEEKEAKARATILEIVGDLPDADIAPPENVLFVCKLNPVTTDEDLEIIFNRFGKIISCEVIRDKKSGESLQYAFIEFADKKSCEDAYFKMDNILIDDRRIHVDFSQSVSKIKWLGKGRGVKHINDDDINNHKDNNQQDQNRNGPKRRDNHSKDRHSNNKKHENNERYNDSNKKRENDEKFREVEKRSHRSENDSSNRRKNKERSRSRSRTQRSPHRSSNNRRNLSHLDHYQKSIEMKENDRKVAKKYKDKVESLNSVSNKNKDRVYEDDKRKSYNECRDNKSKEVRQDSTKVSSKYKEAKHETNSKKSSKSKRQKCLDEKTPSPVSKKSEKNGSYGTRKKLINKKQVKKKRKPSTSSSESDSSTSSSSSSDSSSSTDSNKKKKSRKRKQSSSSSSSSSSTSSSSSSDSSSSSSSSSSDDRTKKRKNKKTKQLKKCK